MSMTRKDYELVADVLGIELAKVYGRITEQGVALHESDEYNALLNVIWNLSEAFSEGNPRFDAYKWQAHVDSHRRAL